MLRRSMSHFRDLRETPSDLSKGQAVAPNRHGGLPGFFCHSSHRSTTVLLHDQIRTEPLPLSSLQAFSAPARLTEPSTIHKSEAPGEAAIWKRQQHRANITTYSAIGTVRLQSVRKLAAQTTEFMWQRTLLLLPKGRKEAQDGGTALQILGGAYVPEDVVQVIKKGPKYSLEPRIPEHELLALNRQISNKADVEDKERCLLDGVDSLIRTLSEHMTLLRKFNVLRAPARWRSLRTFLGPQEPRRPAHVCFTTAMSVVCLALLLVLLDTTVSQEPRFISVLSSEQRNVVVNIVGPLSWNGDPVGFHVIWKATSEHYGPRGELDIPLTRDVNAVNATLQLPEGMVYRIFLSCVVTDASGAKVRGPVLEVEENVPVVGYDVWAYAVDSAQAVVSWRASKSVEIFKVTVYIDEGRDDFRVFSSKTFDGKHTTTTQSFLVTDLQAWGYYEVRLEGCSVENCSKAVKTALRTPPQVIPKPSISRAEATATSSFKLAWLFPQSDVRLFNGFRLWYCPINVAGCVLVYTNERKVNLTGLKPDSTVRIEVQAVFIDTAGKEVLGREATSSVKTWSNLPQVYIEKGLNIQDDVSTCFIYWRCTNSSVDYLE
ncbi:uncharacterized protein LOC144095561 [Amblyomma americanum]